MSFVEFTITEDNLENQKEKVLKILEENRKKIEELLKIEEKTYQNFVRPLQLMEERIGFYFSPISHLNYVKNSSKTEEIYNSLLPELSRYHTELGQNEDIYQALKEIYEKEKNSLEEAQNKVLTDLLKEFELSGVGLEKEKKDRLKEINIALSELNSNFAQNLLKATDKYEMVIEDFEDVKELPKRDLEAAKVEKDGKIVYRFTLKQPSYIAYMTYGSNRKKREELYRAYVSRAPENEELIEKILTLRDEKAKILGFKNYAELSLETKMATDPKSVVTFLKELAKKSKAKAQKEFEELKQFAKEKGFDKELQAFDLAYFSEKLKKEKFNIEEDLYRPYFEKNRTLEGLFRFLKKLFKLDFEKVDTTVWHESVSCYELSRFGKKIGRLYVDLESREGKRGGAWMDEWITHHVDEEEKEILPIAYIVANFAPSTKDTPSLLRPSDVETLFHEMGHALHHLLSIVKEPAVSGISGVEWDAVEFPSQFLENFVYEKNVLKEFAYHYKTEEPLSEEMIERLVESKNFQSAMAMVRQLEFGLFDMLVHMGTKSAKEVQKILDEVREEVSVVKPPKYNKFQWGFAHIFAGGYAAGYYSYKWAEVLSADAFFIFVDNGIYNDEISESYLKEILCKGGSRPAIQSFKAFAKREPKSEALLKLYGIEK